MQITVEKANACKRVIRAEVPADLVSTKLAEGFRDINKQVQFPGFRKGKAPRQMLEKRFGQDVVNDVRQTLADDVVRQAVDEHALKLLGQAELIEADDLKTGSPAKLTLEAEVYPEFELPNYKGLELKRETPKAADHEVYAVMRSEQVQKGELKPVEGPAAKGHLLRGSVKVTCGDETLLAQRRGLIEVGYGFVAGLVPKKGDKALVGAKAGETVTLAATLPADFPREDFRGKDATIEIEVVDISTFEGPSIAEVAKQRGYESEDAWREDVRGKLQSSKEADLDRAVEEQALKKVADATNMDLPEKFSQRKARELVQQQAFRMYQAGQTEEDVRAFLDENKDKGVEEVKAMLKRAFVTDAIARAERLVVTEEDINREINALAERVQRPADEIRTQFMQDGTLSGMREEMKTAKVLKLLRDKAKYV
ncbi:MAG: trigger factor [Planctomycetes bacterium]|nr:trigger factor [Planctomycetota bacterium]